MTDEEIGVVEAMQKYGGGFVKALGSACWLADEGNLALIKQTWPDYWQRYTKLSQKKREAGKA